jgi:hypothetical protein
MPAAGASCRLAVSFEWTAASQTYCSTQESVGSNSMATPHAISFGAAYPAAFARVSF